MQVSNQNALEIFKALRDERFTHMGDKHDTLCETRAYRTAHILTDRFNIDDVRKVWVYAQDQQGDMASIKSPETPYSLLDRHHHHNIEYNFHVAPLITTKEGVDFVFDTKVYEAPPELSQWLNDFSPVEGSWTQKHIITDPEPFLFKRDVILEGKENWPPPIQNTLNNLSARFEFWTARYQKNSDPVRSKWYGSDPRGGDNDHEVHTSDLSY